MSQVEQTEAKIYNRVMNYLKIFSVFVFIYGLCAVPASASLDDSNRYLQPNMENFSKLYWRLGMMDPEIDEQVDNYMAIIMSWSGVIFVILRARC